MMIPRYLIVWVPVLLLAACRESPAPEAGDVEGSSSSKLRERPTRDPSLDVDPREQVREAYDLALAMEEGREQQKALEQVAWDAVELDPAIAQDALDQLTPGSPAAVRLIGHFAMRMADDDPASAIEWVNELENEDERAEAFGRIAVVWSNSEPESAAALVMAEMPPGRPRDRTCVQLVQRWSQQDPKAAISWAVDLENQSARQAGIQAAMSEWVVNGGEEAEAWVLATEEGAPRTEAEVALAKVLMAQTPSKRQEWLKGVDGGLRERIEARIEQRSK